MLRHALIAAATLLGAPAASPAALPTHAPAARDWARVVVATPEGGFRMGNPAAKVKLIEYGSLTCPHCKAFAEEGMPTIVSDYVRSGKLSFEYRNYVRNPFDIAGALLVQCAAPANVFAFTHQIFATQDEWLDRVAPKIDAIKAMPEAQRFGGIAVAAGLDRMAAAAGVPAVRAKQCLADPKGVDRLVQIRKVADQKLKVLGTPTFILNGVVTEAYDWAALKPLLGAPAG